MGQRPVPPLSLVVASGAWGNERPADRSVEKAGSRILLPDSRAFATRRDGFQRQLQRLRCLTAVGRANCAGACAVGCHSMKKTSGPLIARGTPLVRSREVGQVLRRCRKPHRCRDPAGQQQRKLCGSRALGCSRGTDGPSSTTTCSSCPMGTVGNGRFLPVNEPRQKRNTKTQGGPGLACVAIKCAMSGSISISLQARSRARFLASATWPCADPSAGVPPSGPHRLGLLRCLDR